MSVQPTGSIISAPTIPPGADQLADIATIVNSNDPHLAFGGTYETSCGTGSVVGGSFPCAPISLNRSLATATWVQGFPGTVFTGVQCVGPMSLSELQATALLNIDQRVNRTIQDNLIGGFIPIGDFEQYPATDAGGLADADTVARCEYLGQAVIHIHPALAEQWMGKEIIRVGRHLETVMGAMVSLNCWLPNDQIAVTGWLTVYKGANHVMDPIHDTYYGAGPNDPRRGDPTNNWYVNVQTPVTVFNDCNLAALITGVTGGGGTDTPTPAVLTSIFPDSIENTDRPVTLIAYGTDFTKTNVIEVDGEDVRTTWSSPTELVGMFSPTEVTDGANGTFDVTVIGATGSVPLVVTEPLKDASWIVSPSAGQYSGNWAYFRLYEYVGPMNDPQYPDGTTDLTDADIASIDWGDGSAPEVGPFTRYPRPPLTGQFIRHAYDNNGTYTVTAHLVGYEDSDIVYNITIQYYFDSTPPFPGGVLVGAPYGIRPLDGYQGAPLDPAVHFLSIDWGDGTAVQTPPFTIAGTPPDATHVYAAAGQFYPRPTFADGSTSSTSVDVTAAVFDTQEELDAYVAAKEAEGQTDWERVDPE